jgi:hypothetical protein
LPRPPHQPFMSESSEIASGKEMPSSRPWDLPVWLLQHLAWPQITSISVCRTQSLPRRQRVSCVAISPSPRLEPYASGVRWDGRPGPVPARRWPPEGIINQRVLPHSPMRATRLPLAESWETMHHAPRKCDRLFVGRVAARGTDLRGADPRDSACSPRHTSASTP